MIEILHPVIQTRIAEEQIQSVETTFKGDKMNLLVEYVEGGINVAMVSFQEEIAGLRTWVVHHWLDQEQFDALMRAEGVDEPE